MTKKELLLNVIECAREVAPLIGKLNNAMEDLLDEGGLTINEYDTIQYYYMEFSAEGFIDDLIDIAKYMTK